MCDNQDKVDIQEKRLNKRRKKSNKVAFFLILK